MTNPPIPMPQDPKSLAPKIALIVGGICLIGFMINILVIALPPNPLAPQWRLNFLQQVAERSLLLFVGGVLLFYSKLDKQAQSIRSLSIVCIAVGILLGLSSGLVIRDNLTLQDQAISNIKTQASELRARIVEGQQDKQLTQKITADGFAAALEGVDRQTASIQQDIQTSAMKTLITAAGTLFTMGGGLIGLGRLGLIYSMQRRRQRRV